MTRLIDADELQKAIGSYVVDERKLSFNQLYENEELLKVFELLNAMPTVDAVPVIRCRDCKFLRLTGTVWKCQNRLVMMLCDPNDYCSRAERKEE